VSFRNSRHKAVTARDQLAAVLPTIQCQYPEDHVMRVLAPYHLAVWAARAGDPAEAVRDLQGLLPAFEEFWGKDNRRVLDARYELARATAEAGELGTAIDLLTPLLPAIESALGANHQDTLDAYENHASWTKRSGISKATRARQHFPGRSARQ
jgi:hypothetical protein